MRNRANAEALPIFYQLSWLRNHAVLLKEKKAKENSPSHDKYLSLSPSPKGFGTTAIMEVDEGKKIYDKPCQHGSSANSPPAPLDKGLGSFAGGEKKKHENNNTSSHDKYVFPSLSLKMLAGIKLDLDAYVNDPASRQLSKKALCADQMSLVTAAQLSSSSTSPKCISIYNNKRTALSSPAKGGISSQNLPCGGGQPQGIPPVRAQITPKADLKEAFDNALEVQETQWEAERTARKANMAPYNRLVDKVEKEDAVKEAACLT
jgi:hypothetical protein